MWQKLLLSMHLMLQSFLLVISHVLMEEDPSTVIMEK